MKLAQATCVSQVILLTFSEAFQDLVYYPPLGAEPGSGISGRTLACSRVSAALGVSHVPKPLRLRGDETCVQAKASLQRTGAR